MIRPLSGDSETFLTRNFFVNPFFFGQRANAKHMLGTSRGHNLNNKTLVLFPELIIVAVCYKQSPTQSRVTTMHFGLFRWTLASWELILRPHLRKISHQQKNDTNSEKNIMWVEHRGQGKPALCPLQMCLKLHHVTGQLEPDNNEADQRMKSRQTCCKPCAIMQQWLMFRVEFMMIFFAALNETKGCTWCKIVKDICLSWLPVVWR